MSEGSQPSSSQQDRDVLTVASGGGIVFVATFAVRMLNYIYMAVLIWGLGGESFGLFTLALTVVTFLSVLSELGLGLGVVRFGAIHAHSLNKASTHKITMLAIRISLPVGLAFLAALWASRFIIAENVFDKPELANLFGVFSFVIPLIPAQALLMAAIKSLKIMKYSAIVAVTQPLISLIAAVLLLWLKADLYLVAWSFVGSYLVSFGLAILFYMRLIPGFDDKNSTAVPVGELIKFSLPLSMTQWLHFANERTEVFFLGLLSSSVNVGIYRIAWSLAGLETMLRLSLEDILGPFTSDLSYRKQTRQLEALYKTTAKWSFTAALLLFCVYILFGETIMRILEPSFVAGVEVLLLVGLAQLFNEMTGACGTILIMSGRSDLSLLNTLVLFVTSVVLDMTFIPMYGLLGAGIAGGLTIVIVNSLRVMEVWFLLKMHPLKWSFLKPILAGLLSVPVFYLLRNFVYSGGLWLDALYAVLFVGVFAGLLVLQKLDADDSLVLNAVFKKFNGLKRLVR